MMSGQVALKPPSIFCRLSRTQFNVGWVVKFVVPLREESVALFKSCVPLKGYGRICLVFGNGLKPPFSGGFFKPS